MLVLPHQLFEIKKQYNKVIIWEHPHYFTKYNYNKKKLILHKASMEYYKDYLIKKKYNVEYYTFKETPKLTKYEIWDPIDKIKLPGNPKIIESPGFLLNSSLIKRYRKSTNKFFFNAFYMKTKKLLDIMPDIKSQDKYNRKSLPNIDIPGLPSNKADKKYIDLAIDYVNKNFPNNYGNSDNFIFPISHKTAKKWITHFIKYKFKKFGDYQDAIKKENGYLFHSLLSSSINIGLITPKFVAEKIIKLKGPLNSKEGFIRQLFWREYQRYCYLYADFNKNYFGNNKKLTKDWYEGTLGIDPVDICIKRGFETGYLHHIERLMIVGNYMQLSGISPKEGLKWFIEFSCDSYEWVMYQNVLDMVFFVTGGQTMRRPYASSSNYVIKMSNYKKGDWSKKWDKKYKDFIKNNKEKLYKFRYYFKGLKD